MNILRTRHSSAMQQQQPQFSLPHPLPLPSSLVIPTMIYDHDQHNRHQLQAYQQQQQTLAPPQIQQQQQQQQQLNSYTKVRTVERLTPRVFNAEAWKTRVEEIEHTHHVCAFPLTRSTDEENEKYEGDKITKEDLNLADSEPLSTCAYTIAPPDRYVHDLTVFKTSKLNPINDHEQWNASLKDKRLINRKKKWRTALTNNITWYCHNPIAIRKGNQHLFQKLRFAVNNLTIDSIRASIEGTTDASRLGYISIILPADILRLNLEHKPSLQSCGGGGHEMTMAPKMILVNSISVQQEYSTLPIAMNCQLYSKSVLNDGLADIAWVQGSSPNQFGNLRLQSIESCTVFHHLSQHQQHMIKQGIDSLLFHASPVTMRDYFNEFINYNENHMRSKLKQYTDTINGGTHYQIPIMSEHEIHPQDTLTYLIIFYWHHMKEIVVVHFEQNQAIDDQIFESYMKITDRFFIIRKDVLDIVVNRLFLGPMLHDNHLMRIDRTLEWRLTPLDMRYNCEAGGKMTWNVIEELKNLGLGNNQTYSYFIELSLVYEHYFGQHDDGSQPRDEDLFNQPLITNPARVTAASTSYSINHHHL